MIVLELDFRREERIIDWRPPRTGAAIVKIRSCFWSINEDVYLLIKLEETSVLLCPSKSVEKENCRRRSGRKSSAPLNPRFCRCLGERSAYRRLATNSRPPSFSCARVAGTSKLSSYHFWHSLSSKAAGADTVFISHNGISEKSTIYRHAPQLTDSIKTTTFHCSTQTQLTAARTMHSKLYGPSTREADIYLAYSCRQIKSRIQR